MEPGMKECPFCISEIPDRAKKCKFCGETVDVLLRSTEEAQRMTKSTDQAQPSAQEDADRIVGAMIGDEGVVVQIWRVIAVIAAVTAIAGILSQML